MRCGHITFSLLAICGRSLAAESTLPRGVGPDFAKFYASANTFTCISNPTVQIPFSKVNDNFCDCPDGSDEPGTSACAYLSALSPRSPSNPANASAALPGFYCKNNGHNPTYISFSYVNDGICDHDVCCDGSDEWDRVGGTKCEDRCKEIGKEWRKHQEARQKSLSAAMKKRQELVYDAAKRRQEIADGIKTLTVEIEASGVKVAALEKEVADIEESEKRRIVKAGTTGGKVGLLSELAKSRIQELRDALSMVRKQRDDQEAKKFELEVIFTDFKEEYNPNFNDEGVKRAVRAWEEYSAKKMEAANGENENGYDPDIDDLIYSDGIDWTEFEQPGEIESDTAVLYSLEEYLPESARRWFRGKMRDLREYLEKNGVLAQQDDPKSSESRIVTEAKTRLQSSKDTLDNQRREKEDKEKDLESNYGKDDVFRTLKDKCVSLDSGEYTYELCWLGQVTQKSKKGGHHNMGQFERFETVMVDEDVPVDGKGLGSGERIAQIYDGGAHCWNGPNRRTTVILACSEVEEVWRVAEEEKCVYRMEVGTPAVCETTSFGSAPKDGQHKRDEL